jgi:hypothetical protein
MYAGLREAPLAVAQARGKKRTETKASPGHCARMDDSQLERLIAAERAAREHYDSLAGYPADDQTVALSSWQEARKALKEYRATDPEGRQVLEHDEQPHLLPERHR